MTLRAEDVDSIDEEIRKADGEIAELLSIKKANAQRFQELMAENAVLKKECEVGRKQLKMMEQEEKNKELTQKFEKIYNEAADKVKAFKQSDPGLAASCSKAMKFLEIYDREVLPDDDLQEKISKAQRCNSIQKQEINKLTKMLSIAENSERKLIEEKMEIEKQNESYQQAIIAVQIKIDEEKQKIVKVSEMNQKLKAKRANFVQMQEHLSAEITLLEDKVQLVESNLIKLKKLEAADDKPTIKPHPDLMENLFGNKFLESDDEQMSPQRASVEKQMRKFEMDTFDNLRKN